VTTPQTETIPTTATLTDALAACRFCGSGLHHTFVDLGMSPLCESYVPADRANAMEAFYPLHAKVCENCLLVQLEEFVSGEDIFTEYAYFSSYSESWVEHARRYVEMAVERFGLTEDSLVMEVASNDGYLLRHVVERGIPALGIEPAANVAAVAQEQGIPTLVRFFGRECASDLVAEGKRADLIAANNVMAHVPDLNDFVAGFEILLSDNGVVTVEVPHLLRLVEDNQFDTIYHEHFQYFSCLTAQKVFAHHGLELFDVEELKSHGGSLRLYGQRKSTGTHAVSERVHELTARERGLGFDTLEGHLAFTAKVEETKWGLLEFLIAKRREGKKIAGYGAPGKGNTLLNYCGIRTDLLDYTVDRNPYKQGMVLPGTHIPIRHPDVLAEDRPDYILILPWNLKEEIVAQLEYARAWGAQFIVPIPQVEVL
jgi:2-polyprenyl-3-methyl-5-hydroxy-6-metoxy-1,4-benzoquinol methylase